MGKGALKTTLSAILVLGAAAPGCLFSDGTSSTTSKKKTLPDGAPAIACTTNGDCLPGLGDPSCGSATCDDGACNFTYAPEGTALPEQEQTSGDCQQEVCDGSGGVQHSPDATDAPVQTDGDCRKATCNTSGSVDEVADDSDLPVSADGTPNDCETPSCSAGEPSSPPKAAGTLCSTNNGRYCNGGGTCVYCAPLDAACDAPGPATATNNTEGTAYDEGTIGNDDASGKEECGAFTSSGDVDWYHYQGNTETVIFGSPYENDPAGAVSSPVEVTLCIYMTCTEGSTGDFVCPSDTTVANAGGHDGCCKTGVNPGMDIRHVCQDAGVWMSVTAAAATTCAPYDFSFHY